MKFLSTILFLCLSSLIWAGNLVKNGDFTQDLKFWWKTAPNVEVSKNVTADGKKAVCLKDETSLGQGGIKLEPNSVYELTFMVKGENIVASKPFNSGACIVLNANKVWARVTPNTGGARLTGTFDWKRHTYRFNSSRFKNPGKFNIRLDFNAKGTCYFADVKIVKVGEEIIAKPLPPAKRYFRESLVKGYPEPTFYPLGKSFGFAEPGQAVKFQLDLKPLKDLEYSIIVTNDLGEKVYELPRKAYIVGETVEIPGQIRGYYVAEVSVFVKDKLIAMAQGAFVSVPLMKKRDPFFQIDQFGLVPYMIDGYRHLGAGSVVLPLSWTSPGDSNATARQRFGSYYKGFLDSEFDVYILAVGGVNRRTCNMENFQKGYPMYEPRHFKMLEDWAVEAAKLVKGKVKGYGTIMEIPSAATIKHKHVGTWVEAMANQLFISRIFSRAVRSVDPEAKISAGGNNIQMYTNSIEKLVMTDLVDDFDIYNIDAYFGNWDLTNGQGNIPEMSLRSVYLEASALAKSLGKSPMVRNTETGYCIFYGDRFDTGLARLQAALTTRALIISKSAPVESVAIFRIGTTYGGKFVYPLERCMTTAWKPIKTDKKGSPLTHVPLPGGAAYATVARELAFVKFHSEHISGDKLIYSYVFSRPDGKTVVTLWTVKDEFKLDMQFAKPARMVSMFGRESTIPAGKKQLTLTTEPIYIIMDEPVKKNSEAIGRIFDAIRPVYKGAAKLTAPGKAMLYVTNTGSDSVVFKVGKQTLKVLPGSIGQLPVDVKPGMRNIPVTAEGKTFNAPIYDMTVKFRKLAQTPVFDGSGKWLPKTPTGKLIVPDHVYPREALQQERSYFKSPMNPNGHNISAEYYLAYDQKNVYLAVKVDDPIHQQRYRGQNLCLDDCVQFVLATKPVPPAEARSLNTPGSVYRQAQNYGAALRPDGKTEFVQYGPFKLPQMDAKVTRKGNETFYEIAVPWSEIGAKPGETLYFDFVVFDNNKKTQVNAPYHLDLANGIALNRDDAVLPLVIFE